MYRSTAAQSVLFIRVITPSAMGLFTTTLAALLMPTFILFRDKANANPAFQPVIASVDSVTHDPIGHFQNTSSVVEKLIGLVVLAVVASLAAFVLYGLLVFLVRLAMRTRDAIRPNVQAPAGTMVTYQPFKDFVFRSAWRIAILLVAAIYTLLAVRWIRQDTASASGLTASSGHVLTIAHFVTTVAICMVVIHGYVVLLRLFVGRTRLFGEILF